MEETYHEHFERGPFLFHLFHVRNKGDQFGIGKA